MALQMTRPTKHPKTGIYRLRLLIPPHLRDAAKATLGVGHELIANLKTKDEREARQKAPAALASLHARLAALQAAAEGRPAELTESEVNALAGLGIGQRSQRGRMIREQRSSGRTPNGLLGTKRIRLMWSQTDPTILVTVGRSTCPRMTGKMPHGSFRRLACR